VKKTKARKRQTGEENIWNVPNTLTSLRIMITFIVVFLIFSKANIWYVILAFSLGAITDFLDGQTARRLKQTTEFGRKFDIIADRFLWGGTVISLLVKYGIEGLLSSLNVLLLFITMSREIVTLPFAIIGFYSGSRIPDAKIIGKYTTFLQGFAVPAIMASIFYPKFIWVAVPLAAASFISGIFASIRYILDLKSQRK